VLNLPLEISEYDPRWPELFRAERDRILAAIGKYVHAIEHIGSTAIPGIAAKPLIDILVGVKQLDVYRECVKPLADLGYQYVPDAERVMPDNRYFNKGPDDARTHHLHMVLYDGEFWREKLLFRDYLRSHEEVARRYEALKRDLAQRFDDGAPYARAKGPFVKAVLKEAEAAQ